MITECTVKTGTPAWREQDRLAALRDYAILDTEPEIAFDDIARIASQVCRAPVAVVNFIEEQRQWFKSEIGLGVRETPLDVSICAHAILQSGLFVVPDTTKDPRFASNPLVTGSPHLRFYAGALLETGEGLPLGTVCVLDYEARPDGVTSEQRDTLLALARSVMRELNLRRGIRKAKSAEAALADSEARYRALVEASASVCWEAAPDGCITKVFGLGTFSRKSMGSLTEGGWLSVVHPEDRHAAAVKWSEAIASGRPLLNEFRVQVEGEWRWVQSRAVTQRDSSGTVCRWIGTVADVHERALSQTALAASEERYRLAARATADAIYDFDLLSDRLKWAEGGLAIFGYSKDQNDQSLSWWSERVHRNDRERVLASLDDCLRSGVERWTEEYRFLRADGTYADVFERGFLIYDKQNKPNRMVGAMQDITARRRAEAARHTSEERLRLALSATGLGIWDIDLTTNVRSWSDEMWGVLGLPLGMPGCRQLFLERVHPDDLQAVQAWLEPETDKSAPPRTAVFRIIRADNGDERWVETSGRTLHNTDGHPIRMLGTIQDITSRKQAENALCEGEERLRLALRAGRMFAWERDLKTDLVTRSENARDLVGLGSGPASEFAARIHPEDKERAASVLTGVWGSEADQNEIRYIRPDGQVVWLTARSVEIREGGKPTRLIGVTFDITERKAAEDKLWRMANRDPLTGLANRTFYQERLAAALEHAEASGTSVSLLLLDLDDFKAVNDTLGHDAGDALLKETARRLSAMVREGDTVARLGGDEFAIILAEPMNLDNAACFAEMLTEELRTIFEHDGRALSTKASIGVAAFPDHHREPDELMKDADIALYQAKAEGRSRAVVYSKAARDVVEQKVRVIAEVRDGLEADQFVPFYQPKVRLSTSRIVGFEALARWQHPTRGVLTPGYFHPAFSDSEIAVAMGERMIRHVARDVRSWLDQGLDCGRVAVNFSSAEFADPYLARHVLGVLADAGVPTSHFEVEVTESVFLERSTETASAILKEFSEAGVSVALDDFGTGFASLTHLKRYPVHHIKVDQSFVRDLEADQGDAAIVSAVISLGRSLGMQVTVEGVETAGQAQRLRAMGCDHAQGYLYAKPMIGSRVPWLLGTWGHAAASEVRQTA